MTIIFLAILALGLVVIFKYFAIPYFSRRYKIWIYARRFRKMAKGKPPELQEQLKKLADGFSELMR